MSILAITMVRAREEPVPPSASSPEPSGRVPTRVLLVLDQPMVAELVKLTLNHGTFEVRHAVSAAEALLILGQWRPHMVLLDMELEGVAGMRVMDRIGPTAAGGGPIPTIALTRRGDLRTKLDAFERGVDDIA
jgi:PleD family two-component response regulator